MTGHMATYAVIDCFGYISLGKLEASARRVHLDETLLRSPTTLAASCGITCPRSQPFFGAFLLTIARPFPGPEDGALPG